MARLRRESGSRRAGRLADAGRYASIVLLGMALAIGAAGCDALSSAAATDLSRHPVADRSQASPAVAGALHELELDRIGGIRQVGSVLDASGDRGRAAVVCNGLDVDQATLGALAATLAQDGFTTLAYRWEDEHGSAALPTVNALVDAALAAMDALRAMPGIDPTRICVVGQGAGAAVALAAALAQERRGAPVAAVATIDLVDPREAGWNATATHVGVPLASGLVAATVNIGGVPTFLDPVAAASRLHAPVIHIATPGATNAPATRILRAWRAAAGPALLWIVDEDPLAPLLDLRTPGGLHLRRFTDRQPSPFEWSWSRIGLPWAPRIDVAINNTSPAALRVQVNAIAAGAPILAAFRDVPPGQSSSTWSLPRQPTDVTVIDWPELRPTPPQASAISAVDPPPPRPR
ncbi:MAG: hypothetical protein KDA22_01965 [Phycisphaerales bacterium]|nr:hypothetical protein [Phycisphaerales bacterium]